MINTNSGKISLFLLLILTMPVMAASPSAAIGLSDDERKWIKAHPAVRFTGDPNWLPYEAFDSNGNYIGIVSEHLSLISEMTGLYFKMSPSKTWTESTEKAKQGLVDILSETDDSDRQGRGTDQMASPKKRSGQPA